MSPLIKDMLSGREFYLGKARCCCWYCVVFEERGMMMSKHIAFAGKGGTGKTTIAALVIRYLVANKKGTVLAVDADPNATLFEALGVEVTETLSDIVEIVKDEKGVDDSTRQEMIETRFYENALIKADGYDMIVMGAPRQEGCYCFPNAVLKNSIIKLEENYDYMIIDNEAGMEHISRGTIQDVDTLLVVSDGSIKGVRAAKRIYELIQTLPFDVGKAYLIVTRIDDPALLQEEIDASGLKLLGVVPYDAQLAEFDLYGKPIVELPEDSLAVQAVNNFCEKIF
ncbi:MAG: AAA family ATPase [Thermoanaerobacterales bacterium]|jgi:CO dehydrogenase maturation factor|nr:AAA family ATPase [Thermoanaerobacterales bacterium]